MASNSWKTNKTAVDSFKNFRNFYHLGEICPATVDHIAKFIAFSSNKDLASSTVSTYTSGISHEHKINDMKDQRLHGACKNSSGKLGIFHVSACLQFHMIAKD